MNYVVTGEQMTGIADAIRAKTGGTEPITFPDGFVSDIGDITTLAEDTMTSTSLPTSGITLSGQNASSAGGIVINKAKAIKSVSCSGLPEGVVFLYILTSYSTSMKVNCYLYNNTSSTQGIQQASLTVTITYYK